MRTLWWTLIGFLPLPVGLVLVNLAVDPIRLAGGDAYEQGIAAMLLDGHGVTNIYNPKDAAVVRTVIERLPHGPDVIVLGSSRSKQIRRDFFSGRSFFNFSVSGGGLTDYLACHRLYRQRQFRPQLIILEVSPWVIDPRRHSMWEDRYPSRSDLEHEIVPNQQATSASYQWLTRAVVRVKELISPGYFQLSIMTWLKGARGGAAAAPTYRPFQVGDVPMMETELADGSVVYPEVALDEAGRQRVRANAIEYVTEGLVVPSAIDAERVALLESFIRRLQGDGAEVVLYLPPYHPITYERLLASKEFVPLTEVERTLRAVAARTGSTTIGSYDPHALGFDGDAFMDGNHLIADAVARVFATRWPAAAAAGDLRVVGVVNPNGLEVVNDQSFFWMGGGPTCISLKAPATGWARVSFDAGPGPSLSGTNQRRLRVSSSLPGAPSEVLTLENGGRISVVVPVAPGITDACLTPLDQANIAVLPNGDKRPLIIAATALKVEPAAPPPATH